jgi:uncharacterized protein with PQ loop repeat
VETFSTIIDGAVYLAGFFVWAIFIPQIRLLYRTRKTEGLSLVTIWGSFTVQSLILTQSILKSNWPVLVVMTMSVVCLVTIILMVYRYRR